VRLHRLSLASVVCLVLVVVGVSTGPARAGDLVDLFPGLVRQAAVGIVPTVTIEGGANPGTFTLDSGESVTGTFDTTEGVSNLTGQIAGQFQRFPVGSTVAAFTFEFDPELNVFTRSTEGLGPLLSERAQTTGKGKINFAMAYSRVEFSVFEGESLESIDVELQGTEAYTVLDSPGTAEFNGGASLVDFTSDTTLDAGTQLAFTDIGGGTIDAPGLTGFHDAGFTSGSVNFPASGTVLDARLDVDVIAFFLNYGVTDWLDLGLVVPLLHVDASGKVVSSAVVDPGTGLPFQSDSARDDDFGFGDVIVRAKARVLETEYMDLALRGDIVTPTGDEDNFRGFGDPAFGATVILSKTFGMVSPHANAGLQFRTDDTDEHVFRWAAGLDFQPIDLLTFVVDGIGEHHLNRGVDVGDDIFAVSVGAKVNPWSRLVLAGNALVRLNDRGLRADVIPSVTVEYTFR